MENPFHSIAPDDPLAQALSMLEALYGAAGDGAPGWITVWLLPSKHTQWFRAHNWRAAAAYALKQAVACDVYVGVGLRRERLNKGRGEAGDVLALPGLFIDLDIKHPIHKAQNLPETIEVALQLLAEALPLPPTFLLHSGHGLQGFWLWRELWMFDREAERQAAARLLLCFQRTVQATAQLHGWHVDGTGDLARVLRLPGTTNRKDRECPVPVVILEAQADRRYNPSDFEPYLIELGAGAHAPGPSHPLPDAMPPVDLHQLQISATMKFLILTGTHPNDPQRYPSRSEAEFAAMRALIQAGCDDTTIAAVMLDARYGISERPREKGRRWLVQEIARARAKSQPQAAEAQATEGQATQTGPEGGQGPPGNPPPPAVALPLSDLTNAETLIRRHGQDLHYCYPWKSWLAWNGVRWVKDESGEVMRLAKQTIKHLAGRINDIEDESKARAWLEHIKRSLSTHRLKAMVESAQSESGIPVLPSALDANAWQLNCANGVLDLRTCQLHPHHRDYLITKQLRVNYDEHAVCPRWDAFLYRIMGGPKSDEDGNEEALLERHGRALRLIGFLQRAIGYSLTGDTSEQCLFLLHGPGANGKSTFLELILRLLDDYAKQAEFSTFLDRHHDPGVRNDVAELRGARFVSAIEAAEGRHLAEVLVKQFTGGDTVKARFLYQEFFEFRPQFKLFLAANHKPVIRGTDFAIWRRIRLIPFTVTIPKDEQDKQLPQALRQELAGILRWAVQGCRAWQKTGLGEPDEVIQATNAYRQEMDVVGRFIEECCTLTPYAKIESARLYQAYVKWCEDNGETALSQQKLADRLKERGLRNDTYRSGTGRKMWSGIGLPG